MQQFVLFLSLFFYNVYFYKIIIKQHYVCHFHPAIFCSVHCIIHVFESLEMFFIA